MKSCLILALALLAAAQAALGAARVDFAHGEVTVWGPDREVRALSRGAEVRAGDTVRTREGRAQLRFYDGAYVSLQPHSEFAIRDYRFDGKANGGERGLFSLARGAMRTVTGLIGRVNRDRYQVRTPTATIGIRGTGGVIEVLEDGSTLIVGTSGIWSLTNAAGSVDVPAGVSAVAPVSGELPQGASRAPQAGPAPLVPASALPAPAPEQPFRQGDEREPDGQPAGLPRIPAAPPPTAVLQSGPGYSAVFAFASAPSPVLETAATAQFNASGQLLQAEVAPRLYRLDGTHANFATDGILAWGRWTGTVVPGAGSASYSENEGLHYVIGAPPPVLPTQGSATYTLAGATPPTYLNGASAPGSFSGALSVTFGPRPEVRTVDWRVSMPNAVVYSVADTPLLRQSSSVFTGTGVPTTGCTASTACTTDISGFFAGATAERFGAGYRINDGATGVVGAAAFARP